MRHIPQIKTTIASLGFILFFVFTPAFAAEVFFDAKNKSFASGEEFLAQVFLNTKEESLNAIEGKIVFPTDLLEVREIRDGNSSVNFWIEKPHTLQSGIIVFSGITPGGLLDTKEFIFSVIFRAKKEGSGAIEIRDTKVLRNDGKGTEAKTRILNLEFRILESESQISNSKFQTPLDTEPPEDFKPIIVSDQNIFDGKYFLVFATQDKASGIDHYEAREGQWGWFSVSESPYLLKHQSLDRKIFIKAVDKSDNERVVTISAQKAGAWYKDYAILAILALVMIAYFIGKNLWSKFIK